jgi:N-acetylglutamate synthase/N-acetylornithine aminotransferase
MDLWIEGIAVVRGGEDVPLADAEQRALDESMCAPEVEIDLRLPGGDAEVELFFCDFSEEYVRFNSEYST